MEPERKTKVAFIHPDLGIGGAERLVLDVAIALEEQQKEVVFVTNHFDHLHAFEELKDDRFLIRVIGDWIPRSIYGLCQAFFAYVRMLYLSIIYMLFVRPNDQPDVYFVDLIPMAIPILKLFGCYVIYYCHHPDLLASTPGGFLKKLYRVPINWLELKGTSKADVILVNSEYTASVFRTTFPQIKKDIEILYPTISTTYQETISKQEPKPAYQLIPEIKQSPDNFIFLSINRFHPFKQLKLAINAFECMKSNLSPDDWNRVYLVIAGGYDPQSSINMYYFTELVQLVESKHLTTKIIFLKSPDDQLKADLLLACDCLLYTPVKEHFGIVPLEAMLAGKPVIACNSGGPRETVEHGITGYLCENSPESFAEHMVKILDKQAAQNMGIAGRAKMEREFSHKVFVSKINSLVDNFDSDSPQSQRKKKPNPVIVIDNVEDRIRDSDEDSNDQFEDSEKNEIPTANGDGSDLVTENQRVEERNVNETENPSFTERNEEYKVEDATDEAKSDKMMCEEFISHEQEL